ncbi:hypothetical protein AZI85_13875 [Bdellovibrio bacteriovorus]|uniref:Uncharacterized protein n=1 Tax=Bdellovibrio bacteriovorus TaxID=959 RepID=A0A150WV98_BDEBC|nr:hypothetical protein [Bdellovibrio bacteriovorus]KYG70232.1 hypothetical protein AZI85_13875 [Bdellovibrio bacteriovorus]
MKKLILIASLAFSFTANAKSKSIEERINYAATLLAEVAEGSQTYTVAPNKDPKAMILELALQTGYVESVEEFEEHWAEDGSAWETDGMTWGPETWGGASDYIRGQLELRLEEGEQTQEDKIKFAEQILKVNRAEFILRSIKSVKYGVAPIGAVQCGVTFSSLLIIDTENGKIHQIDMEGSGC